MGKEHVMGALKEEGVRSVHMEECWHREVRWRSTLTSLAVAVCRARIPDPAARMADSQPL